MDSPSSLHKEKKYYVKRTSRWRFVDQIEFERYFDEREPFVMIILKKRYAKVELQMSSLTDYWGVETSLSAKGMNKAYQLLINEKPKRVRKKPIVTNMFCAYDRIPLDRAKYIAEQLYNLAKEDEKRQNEGRSKGINPKTRLQLIKCDKL